MQMINETPPAIPPPLAREEVARGGFEGHHMTLLHTFIIGLIIGAPFGFVVGWIARNIAAWG